MKKMAQYVLYLLAYIIKVFFSFVKTENNKVFLISNSGKKYSCNGKAFSEYILKSEYTDFKLVWVYINELTKNMIPDEFVKVKKYSFKYYKEFYSSKFIINNMRFLCTDVLKKRKNQIYLQTWHSYASLKKIEKNDQKNLNSLYISDAKRDGKICDFAISGSNSRTNILKTAFWFRGPVLNIGTLRNDIFFKDNIQDEIYERYNLKRKLKYVLFCPTFRNVKGYDYGLNYEMICDCLNKRMGGEYHVLIKEHPNVKDSVIKNTQYCTNMTYANDDLHELLLISDILVTDYSSAMFDFMLLNRPVFLFMPDLKYYDRDLQINLKDLPFPQSSDNRELVENIKNYNREVYKRKELEFDEKYIGNREEGKASERLYKIMLEIKDLTKSKAISRLKEYEKYYL